MTQPLSSGQRIVLRIVVLAAIIALLAAFGLLRRNAAIVHSAAHPAATSHAPA